jgi:hypothetical protein
VAPTTRVAENQVKAFDRPTSAEGNNSREIANRPETADGDDCAGSNELMPPEAERLQEAMNRTEIPSRRDPVRPSVPAVAAEPAKQAVRATIWDGTSVRLIESAESANVPPEGWNSSEMRHQSDSGSPVQFA